MTATTTFSRPPEYHSGVMTSWIPLTTTYPSISGCAEAIYSFVRNTLAIWDPGYGINVNSNLHCQPMQMTQWWNFQAKQGRFSIGPLVCPAAYTTVTLSEKDATSTFVACCPSGYTFNTNLTGFLDSGGTGQCFTMLAPQVITYGVRENSTWTTTTETLLQTTTAAGIQINGWIFADEPLRQTTASDDRISTSAAIATRVPVTISTSGSLTASSGPADDPGWSVSTKAGIGIGTGIGALLSLALLVLMFRYRHRRAKRQAESTTELDGQSKSELACKSYHEKPSGRIAAELPAFSQGETHIELDASPNSAHSTQKLSRSVSHDAI